MIRTREEFAEKLGLDNADDSHTLLNNMVDVRACYKPSGKVRTIFLLWYPCLICFYLNNSLIVSNLSTE